jgi:hypothetical protein
LFIDNNDSNFYNWFDKLANEHNITIIKSHTESKSLPFDEQKKDLAIYFEKFQDVGNPKITANIAYRIGRKEG